MIVGNVPCDEQEGEGEVRVSPGQPHTSISETGANVSPPPKQESELHVWRHGGWAETLSQQAESGSMDSDGVR